VQGHFRKKTSSPLFTVVAGDMIHLLHVVPDTVMAADALPIWFGAYDAPLGALIDDRHAVRLHAAAMISTGLHLRKEGEHSTMTASNLPITSYAIAMQSSELGLAVYICRAYSQTQRDFVGLFTQRHKMTAVHAAGAMPKQQSAHVEAQVSSAYGSTAGKRAYSHVQAISNPPG
jgi:hypothetical protein